MSEDEDYGMPSGFMDGTAASWLDQAILDPEAFRASICKLSEEALSNLRDREGEQMNLEDAVTALARKRAAMKGIEEEYKRHAKERDELEAQVRRIAEADYANNGNEEPLEGVRIRECCHFGASEAEHHVFIASNLSMWEGGKESV